MRLYVGNLSFNATSEVPAASSPHSHWLVPGTTWAFIGLLAVATLALVLKTSLYDADAIRLIVPEPVTTPWGDRNARVQAPDGMQLTLFTAE